ncbi:hypothetical protein [Prevotella sp.]|uniref:hypothetical protein n=1 Tax=Prevotella sp. TaxID=59823 RepID=UPI002647949F|nr:hypothetical protein [Prevotella sp.]MDN5554786.1 hypothetical protein [Prevotella sp.]
MNIKNYNNGRSHGNYRKLRKNGLYCSRIFGKLAQNTPKGVRKSQQKIRLRNILLKELSSLKKFIVNKLPLLMA